MSLQKVTPVIIDCDPGNDDIWAIISLLKSEKKFNFKLVAITCVNGNTTLENGVQNTLLVLKTLDRLDVPVYAGAGSSLLIKPVYDSKFHGKDGLKDVYEDKPSRDLAQRKHAVEALKDFIDENPNEIVIFAVGPLTNIALLYKLYPEVSAKIKSLRIMGGNHLGVGNATKCAEFNFWNDPEAVHIVLAESKCPVYIVPWETCLEASKATPLQEWRLKVLSKNQNLITNFMDPIDEKIHIKGNFIPCDAYAVACFIAPSMIKKMEHFNVTIELAGNHTRGQMIIDHKKTEPPNAFVIQQIDSDMFRNFLLWICDHENSNFV